ncbi:methionine synthase [Nocardioides jiangxiensis]|uniref:Methionine synthase n=1 Tax=Nocardioides jiangxiensis TaxID=3064524 RepID=A0ABT9B2Y4_9ACTN|nr:methionine synthase [Nocardioides sp. WY-20]MDO7869092.1 methionine synthase [Nocardioides sp. WY-20]
MTATGIGSMPGGDVLASEDDNAREYAEAVRVVLGELPDFAHLPELPGRGAGASMTGRALALVTELGVDLQPAGWRLTGSGSGIDHRRARSLLGRDLDVFEEHAQGLAGPVKVQVCGPWTLAATVEKPRGDKVLADHGARRELAEALALGVADHVADMRRRVPGATEIVVQVDEPALPAVLAAQVPTASGFGKHRAIHPPEASGALETVLSAVTGAGATPVVHCCAGEVPVDLIRGAGARGVAVDLAALRASAYDGVAAALEAGERVLLGVVPTLDPATSLTDKAVADKALRFLDMLGLEPVPGLVLTPGCGLAGASPAWARRALELVASASKHLR